MIDSDDDSPLGLRLIDLYEKINVSVEKVLLEYDWDDLLILNLVYGDQLNYPIHSHIDRMMSAESSKGETLH